VAAGPAFAPSPDFSSDSNQSYPERTRLTLIRTTHSRPAAITWCGALADTSGLVIIEAVEREGTQVNGRVTFFRQLGQSFPDRR
jgi:hypothetical protein